MASESAHLTLLRQLPRCLKRVGSHISTWVSAGSTALGAFSEVTGKKIAAPATVWWVVAICSVFYTALLLEADLIEERARREPLPDMPAADAVRRIIGGDLASGEEGAANTLAAAVFAFQEAAHLGQLAVWGRKADLAEFASASVLSRIDPPFWEQLGLDLIALWGGVAQTELPGTYSTEKRRFFDLRVSRDQVDAIWPVPKRAWRLRLPFEPRTA